MLSLMLVLACTSTKHFEIGVVDVIDPMSCVVQLANEDIIHVNPLLCKSMKEGDVIKVERKK